MVKSKKGMEISINFLVTIILIIVIFMSSIYAVTVFFKKTDVVYKEITDDMKKRTEDLLSDGKLVVIPDNKRDVRVKQAELFGLGILNIESSGTRNTFYVRIDCEDQWFDRSELESPIRGLDCYNNEANNNNCGECFDLNYYPDMMIPNNQKDTMSINIVPMPGLKKGTYTLNVHVCRDDANGVSNPEDCDNRTRYYDQTLHKIRLNIR